VEGLEERWLPSFTATEGVPVTQTVAQFDVAFLAELDRAVIDWGDGTPTTEVDYTNAFGPTTVSVEGTHTYGEGGTYTLTITAFGIQDNPGPFGTNTEIRSTVQNTAVVADLPLSVVGLPVTATEGGQPFAGPVATVSDSDPDGSPGGYTASIDWGDGTTSPGSIVPLLGGTTFVVTGSHAFAEETSTPVRVTVTDAGGGTGTASCPSTILDAPLSATGLTVTATEGLPFTGFVASFTDANPQGTLADFTAAIDWGNGTTSDGTILQAGSKFFVLGSNTYAEEGAYPLSVTVRDVGGSTTTVAATANVLDAPLTSVGTAATRNTTAWTATGDQVVATFTDADPAGSVGDYTALVVWGDGTISQGTVNPGPGRAFTVSAGHVYTQEGTFHASVLLSDAGGSSLIAAGPTFVVADAPLTATGAAPAATEGASFTGVVASFRDADPQGRATDFTATIDWGDGSTTPGTVATGAASGFDVRGSHTYAEEGPYVVRVNITDAGGSSATAQGLARVADAPLAALGSTTAAGFQGITTGEVTLATFADLGGTEASAAYVATIDWGDGSPATPGTVSVFGGSIAVSGSHTYSAGGTYHATVTLTDEGGSAVAATATWNVATNVSGQVQVSRTRLALNRPTGLYDGSLVLTNTSKTDIAGPVQVVLAGLDSRILLASASLNGQALAVGYTAAGDPYVTLNVQRLAAGHSLKVVVSFSDPLGLPVDFTPVIFSDPVAG
jgi:hypothetical protein